ncbi:MAG: SRPBCC family protein [Candidatus Binatia bacterium]
MPEVFMQQRFGAGPERVFDAMTDHAGFGRWMKADIWVERQGTPPPNGLGAVRVVTARGLTVREEIVRWEAPQAMDYRVIAGAPFRDHLGEIRLVPDGDGTRVDYRIRFAWPWYLGGSVVARLVARTLEREISAGLARMAVGLTST